MNENKVTLSEEQLTIHDNTSLFCNTCKHYNKKTNRCPYFGGMEISEDDTCINHSEYQED